MRPINPFSYFIDHASQLRGFGGDRPSPDPQYCFHTRYEPVRPGRATYSLKLRSAQSSLGELTVRVHAFRPDIGGAPSLAAGGRLDLEGQESRDLAVDVPFHAVNGVQYALYGFFSEPTDLSVQRVEVWLEEREDDATETIEPPLSLLADPDEPPESGPASGLVHYNAIECERPVSQDCTWPQLAPGASIGECMAGWRETVCQAALSTYGVEIPGLDGWLVGDASAAMRETLLAKPFALHFAEEAPPAESGAFADLILWPDGPGAGGDAPSRWTELHAWLDRLKIGGLAAIGVRYDPEGMGTAAPSRNEIRQWAFRLIGLGYSVAPLAFANGASLPRDEAGLAACCLVIRRQ